MSNLLKVPEIFALNMSRAADMKVHLLTVEILSICSITFELEMGQQNVNTNTHKNPILLQGDLR